MRVLNEFFLTGELDYKCEDSLWDVITHSKPKEKGWWLLL
jgi:hypothetical protein